MGARIRGGGMDGKMGRMKGQGMGGIKMCRHGVSVASCFDLSSNPSLSLLTSPPLLSPIYPHPSTNTHAPEYLAKYDDFKAKVRRISLSPMPTINHLT